MEVFFVSKPIQYHTAKRIVNSRQGGVRDLIIFGHFTDGINFFEQVKTYDKSWRNIYYFDSRLKAYFFIFNTYSKCQIFLDSDYGKDCLLLKLMVFKSNTISLFEEGLFTYEKSLVNKYKTKYPLRTLIYKIFNLPVALGTSKSVSKYYVYDLQLFKRLRPDCYSKAEEISSGFYPTSNEIDLYKKVFNISEFPDSKKALLYIGPKFFNDVISLNDVNRIENEYQNLIFKPHPGADYSYAQICEKYSKINIIYFDNQIPVELSVFICNVNSLLCLIHHNSSVGMYLKNSSLRLIDLKHEKK
ncbi:MAG: polysialyltransferase family glycosyltransferase [Pseudoalteromonas distincta]|uniref:polysialyltransferase family glycosyltransferase n=1 Tax=Pseudoalteromonas distincta TaxID=77608 RepID=UPI003F9D5D41